MFEESENTKEKRLEHINLIHPVSCSACQIKACEMRSRNPEDYRKIKKMNQKSLEYWRKWLW
jgi:hypothetical protein